MTNSKPDEPLAPRVLNWLHEGGFPLELRVGRLLHAHGWQVHHARAYRDPVTDKSREIDLVATKSLSGKIEGKRPSVSVNLVVECKTSIDKPWVLFHNPQNSGAVWLLIRGSEYGETSALENLGRQRSVKLPSPFDSGPVLVHGAVRAFGSHKDGDPTGPYAAVQGMLAATRALSSDTVDLVKSIRLRSVWLQMWAPLVVVAGELFCYSLNPEGSDKLDRIGTADILVPSTTEHFMDRVPVVSENSLDGMLASLTAAANQFLPAVLSDLSGVQQIADTALKMSEFQTK